MFGVGDFGLQSAVVGEQQQAFAVGIEATGRIDIGHIDILLKAGVFFVVAELADNAVGFIEGNKFGRHGRHSVKTAIVG